MGNKMTLDELINKLEELKSIHGDDCEVVMNDSSGYEYDIDGVSIRTSTIGTTIIVLG